VRNDSSACIEMKAGPSPMIVVAVVVCSTCLLDFMHPSLVACLRYAWLTASVLNVASLLPFPLAFATRSPSPPRGVSNPCHSEMQPISRALGSSLLQSSASPCCLDFLCPSITRVVLMPVSRSFSQDICSAPSSAVHKSHTQDIVHISFPRRQPLSFRPHVHFATFAFFFGLSTTSLFSSASPPSASPSPSASFISVSLASSPESSGFELYSSSGSELSLAAKSSSASSESSSAEPRGAPLGTTSSSELSSACSLRAASRILDCED